MTVSEKRFSDGCMLRFYHCIVHEHDPLMVLVAGVVCVLAAITTFTVLQHARFGNRRRLRWIVLAAVVSGTGIWATHFVAMLAYLPGQQVAFSVIPTFLSVAAAIGIAGPGWWIALGPNRWSPLVGGGVVGAGIGTMHFVGMSGVYVAGRIQWDQSLVLLSLLIGIVLTSAAAAEHRRKRTFVPWRSGLLFALGICGLHFVAMAAAVVEPHSSFEFPADSIARNSLSLAVAFNAVMIFLASFAIVLFNLVKHLRQNLTIRAALDESETLNRGIIDATPDGVSLLELDGTVLFVNQATLREYELADAASLIGHRWGRRFPHSVRVRADEALAHAQRGHVSRMLFQLGGGDERWWDVIVAPVSGPAGVPMKLVAISRDVTEHKKAEELARWAADHDSLTQIPNRLGFQKRLDAMIRESSDSGAQFGLLLLDIDDFKRVNDTIGHDAGDALLCAFAERLRSAIRPADFVARLGGDEFAIILAHAPSAKALSDTVARLLGYLQEPCIHGGRPIDCHASIGASLYPTHGAKSSELLKSADVALYTAKSGGGGNFKLFRPYMACEVRQRASMLAVARDGLKKDWIVPYYQPQIDLRTGAVSGFEALLRWRHPTRGIQEPRTLAAAFNDPNLAAEISDRMIARVLRDVQGWRNEKVDFRHVAINASAAEFRRGDFAERLLEKMTAASVPPECLQVEVTETVFLGRGAEYVEKALKLLSAAGVAIALDDFGTGYASLSHLKQFPVDIIKIDRSFVREVERDSGDAAIVDAVINLGRSLNIRIVAEGVESRAQHDHLVRLGCDHGQGHWYERASPAHRVPGIVRGFTQNGRSRGIAA